MSLTKCHSAPAFAAIHGGQPVCAPAGPSARGLAALCAGQPGSAAAAGPVNGGPAPGCRPAVHQLAEAEHAAKRRLHVGARRGESTGSIHSSWRPCWSCRRCTLAPARLQLSPAAAAPPCTVHFAHCCLPRRGPTCSPSTAACRHTHQLLHFTPNHCILQAFCSMAESTGGLAVEPVDLATRLLDLQVGASFVFLT